MADQSAIGMLLRRKVGSDVRDKGAINTVLWVLHLAEHSTSPLPRSLCRGTIVVMAELEVASTSVLNRALYQIVSKMRLNL